MLQPETCHRVDLLEPDAGSWSLFVTGPYRTGGRDMWGFWNRHTGRFKPAPVRLRERGLL